ncbi:hypothetical protein PPERSA_09968 [Pseudocohnilembus persalinus]|uniref:MIP18 family-like domain-containing protein n=1 Tax=Pseudocohnilembus persalinus TaxID=266149 RepID=A0A0V0QJ75_PSEPJ|nr:hypothetical protein PPERSA_09968 [Pseudocohnilembus persalinus]|eukprot:KRX02351.1 hypothetical protein PPERSA_09968 [Pseudocohnilembus persalinus]
MEVEPQTYQQNQFKVDQNINQEIDEETDDSVKKQLSPQKKGDSKVNSDKYNLNRSKYDSKKQKEIEIVRWSVFDLIRNIQDPELPHTLEELKVVQEQNIIYEEIGQLKIIKIYWVPTVPNCNFATQIGLCIFTKLQNELLNYEDYKFQILVKEGTHDDKENLDKQVNDKERIAAAQENTLLMELINRLIGFDNDIYQPC